MTAQQDYSAMSARELDAAVAERVMGPLHSGSTKDMTDSPEVLYMIDRATGYALMGEPFTSKFHPKGKWDHQWHRFQPSTSHDAALTAAERMREQGYIVEVSARKRGWDVSLYAMNGRCYATGHILTLADLPRAICIACLQALDAAKGAGE